MKLSTRISHFYEQLLKLFSYYYDYYYYHSQLVKRRRRGRRRKKKGGGIRTGGVPVVCPTAWCSKNPLRGCCCEAVALQSVFFFFLLHFVLAHYRKDRHSRCGALWDGPRAFLPPHFLLRWVCKIFFILFFSVCVWRHSTWPETVASVQTTPVCVCVCLLFRCVLVVHLTRFFWRSFLWRLQLIELDLLFFIWFSIYIIVLLWVYEYIWEH